MDFDDLLFLLIKRRLGLCHDHSGKNVNANCEESGSLHIACILGKNGIPSHISTNIYKNHNGIFSYHAENQVLGKLTANKKSKPKNIDLLVIRVTRNGEIANSKPCIKCLQDMTKLPFTKGYRVKNIYYSNTNGKIIKKSLNTLMYDDEIHVSRFYREKKFKFTINK
jgi:cytidine deaminase